MSTDQIVQKVLYIFKVNIHNIDTCTCIWFLKAVPAA